MSGFQIPEKEGVIYSLRHQRTHNVLAWPHATVDKEPPSIPHPLKDGREAGFMEGRVTCGQVMSGQAAVPWGSTLTSCPNVHSWKTRRWIWFY